MIVIIYGVAGALIFILFVTMIHAVMEMNFDKRAAEVFDADDERTEEELKIIHANQLPIRGLAIVSYTLAADMQYLGTILALLCVSLTLFWIFFDIFCAVFWLDKPWYYIGDPPFMNPYLFFAFKILLLAFCTLVYVILAMPTPVPYVQQLSLYV